MTIDDAIRQADALKPNAVHRAAKVEWLDRVERAVKAGVIDLHEGSDAVEFEGIRRAHAWGHCSARP